MGPVGLATGLLVADFLGSLGGGSLWLQHAFPRVWQGGGLGLALPLLTGTVLGFILRGSAGKCGEVCETMLFLWVDWVRLAVAAHVKLLGVCLGPVGVAARF